MKFTLRLGDGRNLDRTSAWICCSTNFVYPGSGSLLAGRKIGYAQALLSGIGFLMTLWFGGKFLVWGVRHWAELIAPGDDPVGFLLDLWFASRWALLGMVCFGVSWLWALITSLSVLRQARSQARPGEQPPVIGGSLR